MDLLNPTQPVPLPTPGGGCHAPAIDLLIFESSPDCVKLLDADGRLLHMNRNGRCVMEIDDFTRLVGQDWAHLWPEEGRAQLVRALAAARAGDTARFHAACPTARGELKWWDVVVTPVLRDARIVQLLAVSRDVSSLVQAQEEMRLIFEHSVDGVLLASSQGILRANGAACEILGRGEHEICGMGLDVLSGPAGRLQQAREAMDRGLRWRGEFEVRRPDGSRRFVEASFSSWVHTGHKRRASVVLRDVTERHEAMERQALMSEHLRQSQKLEALGTLASGVAHDFNNVIAAISGNVQLAQDALGERPQAAQAALGEIARATLRARELVRRIMTFARRQQPVFSRLRLAAAVGEALGLLRATLPSGIRIEFEGADCPVEVSADATQIQQVVMNLGTNAWQATPARVGTIHISVTGCAETGQACLAVRDDGVGMDEKTQARIFEPFFTTKPVGEGTGLGLAVVHGIVQEHGGHVWVCSTPGVGTRVEVRLAAAPAGASPAPPGEPEPSGQDAPPPERAGRTAGSAGRHLLYVDDYDALVVMTRAILQARGWRVTAFGSSAEALQYLRDYPGEVDLLITDHDMPDLCGLALTRAARALRPDLPVILASGNLGEELRATASQAGVTMLFDKPAGIDELCRRIEAAFAAPRA